MCRDGWCQRRAFRLLGDLLAAFDAGARAEDGFCSSLAEAFDAPAVLYVRADIENRRLTFATWPAAHAAGSLPVVVEHLWNAVPTLFDRLAREQIPTRVSPGPNPSRWRGSVGDLLMWELGRYCDVAQVPLHVSDSELRLVALFRRRSFSERDMHVLRTLHRPLATLDHVIDPGLYAGPDGALAHGDGVGPHLTPRELEVLGMVAEGLLARSIAARLEVSTRTVHKHLGNVYRKLEAHDRLLAVTRAQSLGLIPSQRDPGTRR